MTNAAAGGFGRTMGSIAAIVVAIGLVVAGYLAWGYYTRTREIVQDTVIITADSLQRAVTATQRVGDALLARQKDSLATLVARADAKAQAAEQLQASTVQELTDELFEARRADSLLAAAKTRADSEAVHVPPPLSVDSTLALIARQHTADSSATAAQTDATRTCQATLLGCAVARARADSIAGFWQTKYEAQVKKTVPKWQSVSIEVAKMLGVVFITKLILK